VNGLIMPVGGTAWSFCLSWEFVCSGFFGLKVSKEEPGPCTWGLERRVRVLRLGHVLS
jgi:hypothetical protein